MEQLIISISGLRGLIGKNLTPAVAAEYACAFGTYLKKASPNGNGRHLTVCIGQDSRPSGYMIKNAVSAGLSSVGIDVIDLGIVTTPSVGIMLRYLKCSGGVVITASHNPIEYNGIKLLLSDGIAPSPEAAEKIKSNFLNKNYEFADSTDCGKFSTNDLTDAIHIGKILGIIDQDEIAAKKFKVMLDPVNGAGCRITKKMLNGLGCDTFAVNDEPTGLFPHKPEPTAENLADFAQRVKLRKVDVGFAQDPDADRLAIIDENGCYIGEEYTLALAAKYIFSSKKGSAAANLSTSRMIDDIAAKAGAQVIRTPVGEANVAGAMIKNNCVIGGEGNGGVIDLRVGPIRDSLVAIALVLQLMAKTGKSISRLVSEIEPYCMIKDKLAADKNQADMIIDAAKKEFTAAKVNTSDGCKFDFDDGWVHLRTSNTEPIMRIIVEAKDKTAAKNYIDAVHNIRKRVLS